MKVHYFTTDLRVGHDLPLMTEAREPLSRDRMTELVGADRVVVSPATHRDRVRTTVFGLTGESGAERYSGLLQLLHTLRSPDVGNRIEEGRLPQILTDALPPLAENALNAAGEQLDSLSETRAQQERLEAALEHVKTFLGTYRRYAAATIATSAQQARERADKVTTQTRLADELRTRHDQLEGERVDAQTLVDELVVAISELDATIVGIRSPRPTRPRETSTPAAEPSPHWPAPPRSVSPEQRPHATARQLSSLTRTPPPATSSTLHREPAPMPTRHGSR